MASKRKIIYIFGPNRLHEKYMKGEVLDFDLDFGYLKIGETTSSNPKEDKWDAAYNRVKGEAKTGIPETCRIYDVFEYPLLDGITSGKMDDRIRRILTKDMYSLENSKDNNYSTQKTEYEINAGMEFVYGATRKQVLNAIAKFERDLMIEMCRNNKQDELKALFEMVQKNIEDTQEEDDADIEDKSNKECETTHKSALGDDFWNHVENRLNEIRGDVACKVSYYKGKPYISINKNTDWQFCASYSVRHSQTTVSLEVYGGEDMCTTVENFIGAHSKEMQEIISELSSATQGVKNKNKWYWKIVGSYDNTQEKLVEWFANNILKMVSAFSTLQFAKK